MANPEHVAKLNEGVDAWNAWRDRDPDILPNLTGANFCVAELSDANLGRADLSGAHLGDAHLFETVFGSTDLTDAKALETCVHHGESTIDFRTLRRSGELPLVFLRGCGPPEPLIEYVPSLLSQPIQYYSCFISYSCEDKPFTRRLHDQLQGRGIRCWLGEHQALGQSAPVLLQGITQQLVGGQGNWHDLREGAASVERAGRGNARADPPTSDYRDTESRAGFPAPALSRAASIWRRPGLVDAARKGT